MPEIIEQNGKKYLVIGTIAIPFDKSDGNNKPIIEVTSEEMINENGGKNIKIFVPVLKVVGENKIK